MPLSLETCCCTRKLFSDPGGLQLRALQADEDVANCVQPHPTLPVLATSGIESVVRLWRPGDARNADPNAVTSLVRHNQERLKNGTNIYRTVTPRVLAVGFLTLYNPVVATACHLFPSQKILLWPGAVMKDCQCGLQALTHNPELLHMLLERARQPDAGPGNAAAAQQQQEVSCRMS